MIGMSWNSQGQTDELNPVLSNLCIPTIAPPYRFRYQEDDQYVFERYRLLCISDNYGRVTYSQIDRQAPLYLFNSSLVWVWSPE